MARFFDVVLSGFALLIISPLLIPIVIILKMSGEGEVFFVQERIGRHGKSFNLIKFATMLKNSPNLGTGTVTVRNDPRILPFGAFLRKTKINELPQLLNIIKGDMSIIGPRPLTAETFGAYSEEVQDTIKQVRPGLSGLGSVIFRNEEDILHGSSASTAFYEDIIAPYKGMIETWFVKKQNIYVYFMIIMVTVWIVLFPRTKVVWRLFTDLPVPPDQLKKLLNYHEL